jgi:hypothetical protein
VKGLLLLTIVEGKFRHIVYMDALYCELHTCRSGTSIGPNRVMTNVRILNSKLGVKKYTSSRDVQRPGRVER